MTKDEQLSVLSDLLRDQRRAFCAISKAVNGNPEDWTLEGLPEQVAEAVRRRDELQVTLDLLAGVGEEPS